MKKYKVIFLILIILVLPFILTGCGKNKDNNTSNNSDSKIISSDSTSKETEKTNTNTNTDTNVSKKGIHDFFDPTKFDSKNFSGILYDKNATPHTVKSLIGNEQNKTIKVFNDINAVYDYYFTKDVKNEKENIYNNRKELNKIVEYIKTVLGEPTCIYEKDENNKSSSDLRGTGLLYNYDDYIIIIQLDKQVSSKDGSIIRINIREISIISKNVGQNKIGSAADIVKDYYKGMILYGTEITD